MTCDAVGKQLPLLLYGELSFDEEESVQQHLDLCSNCRAELVRVREMNAAIDITEAELDPMLLVNCRRKLRVTTDAIAEVETPKRNRWSDLLGALTPGGSTWNWFGKPVSAVTLVAIGFFGGRVLPTGGLLPATGVAALKEAGTVASRVRFVEPADAGRVQVIVEETRHRVLSGDAQSEEMRELLLRAARESSDPGVRVGTMDLLKAQSQSEEVRSALLHALRHDSNAGVRLKALEALRPLAAHEDTRRVLAEVLLKDENPGVRTQAVDLLTQRDAPELIGVLQEIMTREQNHYVRMKVQRALSNMNASVETF